MNRFYLDKLVVSGPGHENSVISFGVGLNLILGPSNTGKSLITDCIDYVFGFTPRADKPSKIVENNNGYDKITLHLRTETGIVILERKIGDTKIKVTGSDATIEHGNYSVGHTAKRNINAVYLQLLGIEEPHRILSTESGGTQALTWRSILHLFLMRQGDIARESSALKSPSSMGKTVSPASLLFLLTGQDANNMEKNEDPEISKAKRKALTEYIRDKANRFSRRREELEQTLSNMGIESVNDTITQVQQDIAMLQKELDDAASESQLLMSKIYEQNSKLSECNTVTHSFSVLRQQYQSDIRRLNFIVDGRISTSALPAKKHCPFCDTEIPAKQAPQYADATSAELAKIKGHLTELEIAQRDIDKQRQSIEKTILTLEQQKEQIDSLIEEQLAPKLAEFKKHLEGHLAIMRFAGELDVVRENETQYKSELFEKETEEIPDNPKYNIINFYDFDLVHGFEEKLVDILRASKIGGATTARLNMANFDIEIGGLKKAVSMGGGFCALLNTITNLAMSAYIIAQDGKAPGFFLADSVLTQLSEAEYIEQENTIKQNFMQYLVDHALDRQVIIIEQKKRMPFIPKECQETGIRVIEFTRDRNSGRYGFLNDVYNVEDQ